MSKTKMNYSNFSYSEFVDYALSTDRVIGADDRISERSRTNDFNFTGTESIEDAINYARHGWDSGIKELELEKDLIIDGQFECYNSIVGSSVDVGAFLSGDPECMIQFVDKIERDRPELTIYTMLTYSGFKSQVDALKYAKRILNIIVNADREYSVRLVGVFASRQEKNNDSLVFVTIKNNYQNLVLNNLAFAFHPSFFRRLWFRFAETKEYRGCGYGRPYESAEFKNEIRKYHEKNDRSKAWVLPTFQHSGYEWEEESILKF
ncbi:hypothetical protein CMU19_04300 [Elizabethkingia anophelis]|nr:hypothetical protein [Elizabethkingia anophelis]